MRIFKATVTREFFIVAENEREARNFATTFEGDVDPTEVWCSDYTYETIDKEWLNELPFTSFYNKDNDETPEHTCAEWQCFIKEEDEKRKVNEEYEKKQGKLF